MNSQSSSQKLIPSWVYFSIILILLGAFVWLNYQIVFNESSELRLASLRRLIVYDCFVFTFLIIFINIWSISQIHEYLKRNSEKIDSEKDLPCHYCNKSPSGPLLCSNCNSILWGRIGSTMTDVAVFIAQHRWSITTAIFALFLIAPLSYILNKIKEREDDKIELINEAKKLIDERNKFRSEIAEYELLNKNTGKIDANRLSALIAHNKEISWETPRVFEEITQMLDTPLTSNIKPKYNSSNFDVARFVNKIIVEGTDTVVVDDKQIKIEGSSKDRWKEYLFALHSADMSSNTNTINIRKRAAYDLDIEFRVTNAVIREFINKLKNIESKNIEDNKVFMEVFGKDLEEIEEISTSTYLTERILKSLKVNEYPIIIPK